MQLYVLVLHTNHAVAGVHELRRSQIISKTLRKENLFIQTYCSSDSRENIVQYALHSLVTAYN